MELLRKVFINKRNGQASLTLPKDLFSLKNKPMPSLIRIKISIPKVKEAIPSKVV